MIETDRGRLTEFLKGQGASNLPAVAETTSKIVESPVVEKAQDVGASVDTFVKLLESVNKLLSNDLVSGLMSKGVERKSQALAPQQPPAQEVPEGFMPVNQNTSEPAPAPQPAEVPKINYDDKSKLLVEGLEKTLKNLVEQKEDRTIKEVLKEFEQEEVKKHFQGQIKILLES